MTADLMVGDRSCGTHSLVELFASHEGYASDKWEHYLQIYAAVLAGRIEEGRPVRLLEIGVQNGGSLEIWSKFLPKGSTIVGIDIDPACAGLTLPSNVRVAIGDASDPLALERMLGNEQFDVVIDDGSHQSGDIISTFEPCFRRLDWGGIYFAEDMHCSYFASHGGGFRRNGAAIEWFKNLVDALNSDYFEPGDASTKLDEEGLQRLRLLGSEIAAIAFLDSVVMVKKLTHQKVEPYRRVMTGGHLPVADMARAIISLPISQLQSLTLSSTAFDGFAPVLLNSFASAKENVGQLRESAAQFEASARSAHQRASAADARVEELEAKLETRDAVAERRARKAAEELADAKGRVRGAEAKAERTRQELKAIKNSRIWRSTRPYRAVMDFLRGRSGRSGPTRSRAVGPLRGSGWLLRNTRRALRLVWWLSTGQFSRVASASLPYYQRFVPARVKAWIPERVREAARRRLPKELKAGRFEGASKGSYSDWITRNDTLSDDDRAQICADVTSFRDKPKFSIVMPVYNTRGEYLRQAIDSVLGQLYRDWELCVVDDASPSTEIRGILEEYAHKDARIRPKFRDTNGGISACSNTALEMASGGWIILMDHDDVLAEHALYLVAEAVNSDPHVSIVYSDEDTIDAAGRRSPPYFKPDWDYDLFLGQNLINHLGVYRADLTRKVGGFREGFEGSQDWDLALRVLDAAPDVRVHHIPFILYHWRRTDDTFSKTSLARARDAAERAVNEHFARTEQAAVAYPHGHSSHLRIKRDLPAERPLVSIIIPTKDRSDLLRTCIDGLVNRTDYEPIEIVVVDNGSSDLDALEFLADIRSRHDVKVVENPKFFNFSRLVNLGVAESSGEILVLLNNDVNVINTDWLTEMVGHALRPAVGAVGAKLYYANDTLQHGGVILGLGSVAGHAHRFLPRKLPGYFNRLNLTHNLSCVTAACLATRREVYDRVGGFNEQDLTVAFNDVDFCIRVRQAGYRIIWTPHAELYHYESLSRGRDITPEKAARAKAEQVYLRQQWASVLDNDPFYNPNLSLASESFQLSAVTRARKPWLEIAASSCPARGQISSLLSD